MLKYLYKITFLWISEWAGRGVFKERRKEIESEKASESEIFLPDNVSTSGYDGRSVQDALPIE